MTITLFFLQASRCIRSAWLLEELGLDYEVKFSERVNWKAPEEFKLASGNPIGKFPTLKDGDLVVFESGNINDYLCDKYDKAGKVYPKDPAQRVKVGQWVHASEGTFALHALAIAYARWNLPKDVPEGTVETMEKAMSVNVQDDLSWLETELSLSTGKFLCGDHVTAADIMMEFSAAFILARELGTQGKEFPNIKKWMEACRNTDTYKRAVEKTGYKLY